MADLLALSRSVDRRKTAFRVTAGARSPPRRRVAMSIADPSIRGRRPRRTFRTAAVGALPRRRGSGAASMRRSRTGLRSRRRSRRWRGRRGACGTGRTSATSRVRRDAGAEAPCVTVSRHLRSVRRAPAAGARRRPAPDRIAAIQAFLLSLCRGRSDGAGCMSNCVPAAAEVTGWAPRVSTRRDGLASSPAHERRPALRRRTSGRPLCSAAARARRSVCDAARRLAGRHERPGRRGPPSAAEAGTLGHVARTIYRFRNRIGHDRHRELRAAPSSRAVDAPSRRSRPSVDCGGPGYRMNRLNPGPAGSNIARARGPVDAHAGRPSWREDT
jgi:hypothetical protein